MSEDTTQPVREALSQDMGDAPWSMLEAHAKRGGLIFVDGAIELLDVGEAIAGDDSAQVAEWMTRGLLTKPDEATMSSHSANPDQLWRFLIVQPFVLVDARPLEPIASG